MEERERCCPLNRTLILRLRPKRTLTRAVAMNRTLTLSPPLTLTLASEHLRRASCAVGQPRVAATAHHLAHEVGDVVVRRGHLRKVRVRVRVRIRVRVRGEVRIGDGVGIEVGVRFWGRDRARARGRVPPPGGRGRADLGRSREI